MIKKSLVFSTLVISTGAFMVSPVFAETSKDAVRTEKLEERMSNIEARVAKVEADSHKGMGMMEHGHDAMNKKGMGMNSPMGQAPQADSNMGNTTPQTQSAPQQGGAPAGGMPAGGGMGDM